MNDQENIESANMNKKRSTNIRKYISFYSIAQLA